ncbi:MAG: hypothetical protein EPO26_05310 [Chloroflexota bacterium]|nr:MAG: hypothetical protein EPO26_05310 [Chloroflexota bacterium]
MTFAISVAIDLHFASIDAFLLQQREIVAEIRRVYERDADLTWESLDFASRQRFASNIEDLLVSLGGAQGAWRRAWWLHAIGSSPRAPFETATRPEHAARLVTALRQPYAPGQPPGDRPAALDAWWSDMTTRFRAYIARHTSLRVAAARHRLATEGLMDVAHATPPPSRAMVHQNRRSRRGATDRQRIREAESECVATHQTLDRAFAPLGPVCGACTAETGGCCSLTVPLIWREVDFRLLAMDDRPLPEPSTEIPTACPFLGETGCRLPSDRRPHICRVFLCDKAENALSDRLPPIRQSIDRLTKARSRLG